MRVDSAVAPKPLRPRPPCVRVLRSRGQRLQHAIQAEGRRDERERGRRDVGGNSQRGVVMSSSHVIFIPDHFDEHTSEHMNEYAHAQTRVPGQGHAHNVIHDPAGRTLAGGGVCGTERQEARQPGSCRQGRWAAGRWAVGRWAAGRLGRRRQPHQRVVTLAVSRVVFEFTCQPIPIRSLQV